MARNEAYDIWWAKAEEEEINKAFAFSRGYMDFLGENKTEREVCNFVVERLEQSGFVSLDGLI